MTKRSRSARRPLILSLVAVSLLTVGPVRASEVDRLSEELISLRGQVEDLHQRVAAAHDAHRSRMVGLARQDSDLEAEIQREELALAELEQTLAKVRAQAQQAGLDGDVLEPAVLEAIGRARDHVRGALPFKVEERLATLVELERQLAHDAIGAHRAANRLWAFYEDELRMTSEHGLYRQNVDVGGEERLADVARLGMTMMFFRTSDDRFGVFEREPASGWVTRVLASADERALVRDLFDSLEKQVRTGLFTLPAPHGLGGL